MHLFQLLAWMPQTAQKRQIWTACWFSVGTTKPHPIVAEQQDLDWPLRFEESQMPLRQAIAGQSSFASDLSAMPSQIAAIASRYW